MHMHVLTVTNLQTKIEMTSFTHSKCIIRVLKYKNGSHDSDDAHYKIVCYPKTNNFISSTCVQNLKTSFSHSRDMKE